MFEELFCTFQEMARVLASGSRGSPTSGSPTLRSDTFLYFDPPVVIALLYNVLFIAICSPILQVAEQAQILGSGLLAKGCQPTPEQFVGIFAQNRPEV